MGTLRTLPRIDVRSLLSSWIVFGTPLGRSWPVVPGTPAGRAEFRVVERTSLVVPRVLGVPSARKSVKVVDGGWRTGIVCYWLERES